MAESDPNRRITDRLVVLEEWMMHTDRLLANLDEVVRALQDRLDELHRRLASLGGTVAQLTLPDEQRSFEDERPPHY
ncbi:MAG: SlyX family protein [Planctomycetaceae bacterium]|nr:SlyX family protein [Planctomycetaceae bacterium]